VAHDNVMTLTSVLEHMMQPEREHCVREAKRLLKSGGEVFIFDTPNSSFPFDFHTTRLWSIGWMPLGMALRYAKLRKRVPRDLSMSDFLRRGSHGISRRLIDKLFDGRD